MNGKRHRLLAGAMLLLYLLALSHGVWEAGHHDHHDCVLCHAIGVALAAVYLVLFAVLAASRRHAAPVIAPFWRIRHQQPLLRAPPALSCPA